MSKQTILNASAMAALCALAAFSLQAKAQQQAPAQPASQHSQEGMVAVRDAQSGKLRPATPDELKALRARDPAPAALAAGRTQQQHQSLAPRRDSTRGVRLGDRTMVYDVVTRGADGKLSSECVHGAAAAEAALRAGAPATDAHDATDAHEEHVHETR